jgi:hypothetical protein
MGDGTGLKAMEKPTKRNVSALYEKVKVGIVGATLNKGVGTLKVNLVDLQIYLLLA